MADVIFRNLLAWCAQAGALAVVAAAALWLLRLREPALRVRCLRSLLAALFLLPIIEPWHAPVDTRAAVTIAIGPAHASGAATASAWFTPSLGAIVLAMIAAGIAWRLFRIGLGLLRLRRYERHAMLLPDAFADLRAALEVTCRIYASEQVTGPVTFGFLRPVVLVPPAWAGSREVICHELLHVRRRDWVLALGEELLAAVLWFHPAVWWIVAEIQLAREQAVDREAISLTKSREQYVDTLLAVARAQTTADLAPAPLFLKKRHLRSRVTALFQEIHMPVIRSRYSIAAFVLAAGAAALLAVHSFPLQAAPQEPDAAGVTVHTTAIPIVHRTAVQYPREAVDQRVQGQVAVDAQLDHEGKVTDARVLSGPAPLRDAALNAVRDWTFAADSATKTKVVIDFQLPDTPPANGVEGGVPGGVTGGVIGGVPASASVAPSDKSPEAPPARIRVGGRVQANNLVYKLTPRYPKEAKEQHIQGAVHLDAIIGPDGRVQNLDVIDGDPILAQAATDAVRQWVYRPTLLNGNPITVETTIDVNFTLSK